MKYCQQLNVGGMCGAPAKYRVSRVNIRPTAARLLCERCKNNRLHQPNQRDKFSVEEIANA